MRVLRLTKTLSGLACLAAIAMLPANAAGMQMAITFDDLPAHASLPPGVTRIDVAKSIIHALNAHHAPSVFGFVNAQDIAQTPADAEVLQLWRAAGYPLGNHTYSHPDANTVTAAAFERDVLADEPTLRKYMGRHDWHWLRLPYLHEGDTPEKRQEIAGFLEAHKYRLAQVTLSFDDYAYNDPYARCMKKGNKAAVECLVASLRDPNEGIRWLVRSNLRRLTGLKLGADPAAWEQWWKENGRTFTPQPTGRSGRGRN